MRRDLPRPFRQLWDDISGILGWLTLHWLRFRRALRSSPEWYFALSFGSLGLVLTLLLFLSLPGETPATPPIQPLALATFIAEPPKDPNEIDTRLVVWQQPTLVADRGYEIEWGEDWQQVAYQRPPARALREETPPVDPWSTWETTDPRPPAPEPAEIATRREPVPVKELIDDPFPEPFPVEPRPAAPRVEPADLSYSAEFIGLLALEQINPVLADLGPERAVSVASQQSARAPQLPLRDRDWQNTGWAPALALHAARRVTPTSYASRNFADSVALAPGWNDGEHGEPQAQHSSAEVALRLQLRVPVSAGQHQRHRSEFIIENRGSVPLHYVKILESLAQLETVVDAAPPARVNGDSLEREFWELSPDHQESVELEWVPQSPRSVSHAVRVTAGAAVTAMTEILPAPTPAPEPTPPRQTPPSDPVIARPQPVIPRALRRSLACQPRSPAEVRLDGVWELSVDVINTGEVPLSDIRILASIPTGMTHRHGPDVECRIGLLHPGESRRAILRTLAEEAGPAISQLTVVSREQVSAVASATTEVVQALAQPRLPDVSRSSWQPHGTTSTRVTTTGR